MTGVEVLATGQQNQLFVARFLSDTLNWGEGNIVGAGALTKDQQADYAQKIISCLAPIEETSYSDCGDGRRRVNLRDGKPVPLRAKLIGADPMMAFTMADALGANFFTAEEFALPALQRFGIVLRYLHDSKIVPSAHEDCGMAGGYPTVNDNQLRWANNKTFVNHERQVLPPKIFDPKLFSQLNANLSRRNLNGYDPQTILAAVQEISGKHAVACYQDDGRGVHGHHELLNVVIRGANVTVDNNKLADQYDLQVFCQNPDRLKKLAQLFGRGTDDDYRMAIMAGQAASDAGLGTLAKNLPTMIIEPRSR